jgi:hypothetical protein
LKDDLLSILAKKYALPYWAFIREFRNATGFSATRSADALAFGMYRSRGQAIIGFEVKTVRSDWLRELKNPEKAEPIAQFCDYFYLVVPSPPFQLPEVAQPEELPAPWGLIGINVVKGKSIFLKQAEKLDAAPLSRPFLCAIVKQAMDSVTVPIADALKEARAAGYREGQKRAEEMAPGDMQDLRDLEKQVLAFEKTSGIRIHAWEDGQELAALVALARKLKGGDQKERRALENAHSILAHATLDVRERIAEMEKLLRKKAEES